MAIRMLSGRPRLFVRSSRLNRCGTDILCQHALLTLCLLLSCRWGMASVVEAPVASPPPASSGPPPASSSNTYLAPVNPATVDQLDMSTPAMMALPVNTPSLGKDASTTRKFYTITASLREIYDTNVNTSSSNTQSSSETELSPSVLVDFPTLAGDFSARYTFDITYYHYANSGNNGNGGNSSSSNDATVQLTHEFVAQYSHAFSERFNLALAEQFRYYIQPSLYDNVGTAYQDGAYISNTIDGTLSSQWTPLVGTSTTYSNTVIKYEESDVAIDQNSVENTASETVSFAVLPKISVSLGGIGDNITYQTADRGYTTYTGFVGGQWEALPTLSMTARGGGTYDETVDNQSSISPYGALSLNWSLGAHSQLSFNYAHEITPSDQVGANGQTSDRVSASFRYDISATLSSHLQTSLTSSNVPSQLSNSAATNNYSEYQYYLDTGLTYHYNSFLDFDSGITLTGVSSDSSVNDYNRDEVYIGVRGTY